MVWECLICDWRYDPETGAPTQGLAAGTAFDDVPSDWTCPDCGASKADFVAVEASA